MMSFRLQSEDLQERVNEILMDSKLSVIVEGEHDLLVYEVFLDEENCHIEQFRGKEDAVQVIGEVNKIKPESVLAILDKDLDAIKAIEYPANVFLTDAHDIDTQMFLSDAFFRVARELYKRTNTTPRLKMSKIRDQIIAYGRSLSYMRILSNEQGYNFAFKPSKEHDKKFPYNGFIKVNSKECVYLGDMRVVTSTCRYGNQGIKEDASELFAKLCEISSRGYEDALILHGHDLMNIMGLFVLHYGNTGAKDGSEVEQAFRLTYHEEFYATSLYNSLKVYSNALKLPFLRGAK